VDVEPASNFQHARAVIRCDQSGNLGRFNTDALEPIPEPPITNEEIGRLIETHNDFESFSRNGSWWQFQLVNPYTEIKKPTKREALESLVLELRKRSADANKKEQS
jgi:hypothetical protein